MFAGLRVVLAHDWLTGMRGGERVLDELCALFPSAPLWTLVWTRGAVSARIEDRPIHTSLLQSIPGIQRHYRGYLPLMPMAVESLRLPPCDLVLSSSHAVMKAVRPPSGARHLCYLHTPMRYAWDQAEAYFGAGRAGLFTRAAAAVVLPALRQWDVATTRRVDRFVCNSRFVRARALRAYGRESAVVCPPVDLERFSVAPRVTADAAAPYLMVTAFAPYKGIEEAIEAFRVLRRPLDVIGGGQFFERLRPRFGGDIRALGPLSDEAVTQAYRRCRALVVPATEDFGITPLEAQASGRPVIALGRGGALETVVPLGGGAAPTGVLYEGEDPVVALVEAVRRFEQREGEFEPAAARSQAERFSSAHFRAGIAREVQELLDRQSLDR